jgi:hypothetical protein
VRAFHLEIDDAANGAGYVEVLLALPGDVQEWLAWQKIRSAIPGG